MHDDTSGPDSMGDGSDDLLIRRAARELQAPVAFGDGFDARVMAAVRAAAADEAVERRLDGAAPAGGPATPEPRRARPAAGPQRAWAWVTRPRELRVSPLAGLAAAAALAIVMAGIARRPAAVVAVQPVPASDTGARLTGAPSLVAAAGTGAEASAAALDPQPVQFVLVAPSAKSVTLVGDFNDWSTTATPLVPVRKGGVWTITVPLPPGRYTYNFVVDGSRVLVDPTAPAAPTDDFGTPASIVTVAGAQS